jgi:ABC-type Fe3+-hydroxamate transport system substrate-binding protein
MKGGALSTGRFLLLIAALAALLTVAGCGGSSGDEVTVQTGSLSKTDFIAKADAVCKAARTEFIAKFEAFGKAHKSELSRGTVADKVLSEILEVVVIPNFEGQIEQISKLGAPKSYAPEAAAFLNALQKRLDEAGNDPSLLNSSPFPFKNAEEVARRAGMNGCAESFG